MRRYANWCRRFLVVFFLLIPLIAMAQVNIEDFAKSPTMRSPSLSPDGQYLALSLHNNKAKWNESDYQLVVFHLPDLKGVSRLNMAPHYQPAQIVWVSNNRLAVSLAYISGYLDVPQLTGEVVALDSDGGHKRTLYSLRYGGMDTPRGAATIAGTPFPRNGHIYLHFAVWPERHISDDRDSSRSAIYDVDTRNGKATLMGGIEKGSMSFVVHDEVARFAYGSSDAHAIEVYTHDNASQPWRRLSTAVTGKKMVPLRISRDGSKLWSLFSATGGPQSLVVSALDGSNRTVLAGDDSASVDDVLWDTVTGTPYAAIFMDGRPHVVYLDQSPHAKVLKALNDKFPDHLVTIAGLDDSGKRMLVSADSDRDPGSVALFDTDTMNLRPLYQVEDWIHPEQMAMRKPFRFKASDGLELEGYLTLPPGKDTRKLPTILMPHGGPIDIRDGWTYDAVAQFLASRGYAVVQVNYRGSAGRGPDFEMAGYRHFGDRIQQDLLDGLHWAIDQGYADQQRLCVYGGSFGGYSSLMQPIAAPGLYKCAIDYAGVSDWGIGFKSSDTAHFSAGRTYFAESVGDMAAAHAISPLYQLDKFNVPVLIAHGEDDQRVPYQNATDLRAALKKLNKPYEWLSKPKEGHGFYTEEDRADMYQHMQDFLAKYLGP
ncbi:S9 family peptidase [Rhodanobacter sp. C03]|nr:S9 family peptidase [Rhodanobacter sp. C03]